MNNSLEQVLAEEHATLAAPLLLSFENVAISYESALHPTVENIDFKLHTGESVLFLGPSGCGKSTVAMLCAGLIPRSVEAVVTGEIWRAATISRPGQVGYVFQDPDAQFCMLSVGDEIAFGLENQSISRDKMPVQIRSGLARAHLDVPNDAHHATFSGGMKQKLALASALALDPILLILDEPTANLDPLASRQVFNEIANLQRLGQTMIVIEHKFEALIPYMNRIVLFDRQGSIHRIGQTEQVLREEWAWLIEEGVVLPWKTSPGALKRGREQQISMSSLSINRNITNMDDESAVPSCSLTHASVKFGHKTVLQDISVSIPAGAFVAIVGPNGAGKSTLLQTLAGLVRPTAGMANLFGQSQKLVAHKERSHRIAYCFQNPEFQFIFERVGDELANRVVGPNVPMEVQRLLDEFGLTGMADQSPFSLSQGQKRRLSVATMLRETHEIYFLDEPTFGQDAKTQEVIMARLAALNQSGKTIIMTTHHMDLVRRFATTVITVVAGQVQFMGTPLGLFAKPAVLRIAHLLDDVGPFLADVSEDAHDLNESVTHRPESLFRKRKHLPPILYLHPVWLLISMLVLAGVAIFATTLPQAIAMFMYPFVLMMVLAWMTPWKIMKYLSPFLLFYVLYLWSFVANAAVPPGTKTVHFLWMQFSMYGLHQGLIFSIRMLGSGLLGIMFVLCVDMTDLMVGLTKDFLVPPKFSYGTLAGLRVVPLFTTEWQKLRQARQLRGRDALLSLLRPITYAIPLLSQAIRMSERVAIAMEARGFFGGAAQHAKRRTFYRLVPVRVWDYVSCICLTAIALLCLLV